ncbi:uncharacterized protein KY384_001203 [Bacidia gigantensis]|uniref:uncharacterized protein n=1 Tax=Bacidia gigantensis TaxID=2732470 RepID=UPI001D040581|nr:uncharacterized protein KY384_001203 [Bacidia gigantensis]KAG8534359.1 hypothetical protein KY384_001203 [Bacidia gigantensis]
MADPFSLAASIITVVQATSYAIKFIGEVKDSSHECSKLLVELSMTAGILDSLKNLLESDSESSWLATAKSLAKPQGPLKEFGALVERLISKLKPATGLRRAGKAIAWPFRREEVKDMLATIERQKTMFVLALELDHVELSNRLDTKITELTVQMKDLRHRDINQAAAETRTKILNWLSQLQPHKKHSDVSERRLKGTGEWVFDHEHYKRWFSDAAETSTLWCPGIPGAGKTIISSLVIDRLRRNKGLDVGLAFFYCDYRDIDNHTTANIIASLTKQLAHHLESLPICLTQLFNDCDRGQRIPDVDELEEVILEVCKSFRQVFIVIDALDECDAARYRPSLLKILALLEKRSAKLFITSRPFADDIRKSFGQGPQISISAQQTDIRRYLQDRISNNAAAEDIMERRLQAEIFSVISEGANGMFLLPALQIQTILDETTRKGMRKALRKMPKSLDATFGETLKRLQRQSRGRSQLGLDTLMWISHAKRPLRVDELQQALAIDDEDTSLDTENYASVRHIVECCLGLVTIDEESSSIRLVHYSVQEYLQEHKAEIFPDAEKSIAETCLTFLSFKDFDDQCNRLTLFDTRIRTYPFLMYAAQNWGVHAKLSPCNTLLSQIMRFTNLELNLFSAEQAFQAKFWYRDPSQPRRYGADWERWYEETRRRQTGLHVASRWGLDALAVHILQESIDVNARNSRGETALWWAVRNELDSIVEMLLDARADGSLFETKYGDTPIILATASNNEKTVRLLLRSQVDCNKGNSSAETALYKAAVNDNLVIVKMLLDAGALPNVQSHYSQSGGRVLLRAEQAGQIEIILTQFDKDGGGASDYNGKSALQTALDNDNIDIVRALVDHDVTMDQGQREIYEKLLERGKASSGKVADRRSDLSKDPENREKFSF